MPSAAQERIAATRVFTEPTGFRFFVDGEPYRSAQTFLWPAGSKHTIFVEGDQFLLPGHRSKFSGWSDSTGRLSFSGDTITVTADPSITSFKASFSTEYLLRVLFSQCNTADAACRPPGSVSVGGGASTTDIEQWMGVNSTVVLQAFPNTGFVFNGWGPQSGNATSFMYTHTMTGPITFSNIFAPAKRVTLLSEPAELLVAPDRTPTRTPAEMDWGEGTRHVLGVVSPQSEARNSSNIWVFKEWSNGARLNDVYVAERANISDTLTARFVPGTSVSFLTNPLGLKVRIEGRDNWPAYNFVWGVGLTYNVAAPLEQTDSKGRRYVFKGWSNGKPATHDMTVTAEDKANGLTLIATYEPQNKLTISSNPPGLPLMVDGKECRGTCTIDKPDGSQVQISATQTISISDSSRFELEGWSDGGAASRTLTVTGGSATTLVANYRNSFRLMALAEPGNGAQFNFEPASPDGFYPADTNVMVTADIKPGFRFRRWDGDLAGSFRAGSVYMSVPRVVRAFLEIAPYADESGARNAAGDTPEPTVAPGSIAAVFGANLAAGYEVGPGSPLAQTIGGVTVRLANRFLPLVFVSPEQINLQVPSDLPEGVYALSLQWGSYTPVSAQMRVQRNAPGLFQKKVDDKLIAAAVHEDGQEITLTSGALRSEVVTLFGTGFGPYERSAPDGFPLPAGPSYALVDPIEVIVGESLAEVVWAGGAPGQIGASMVRFKLPAEAEAKDGVVSVRVRVNGHESNPVFLKVE
jgi:uncharacterized protein (TIGR03437 family)